MGNEQYKLNNTITFLNPYNFVSLSKAPERVVNVEDEAETGRRTGYLACEMTAKTPLVIPDVAHKQEDSKVKDHYHYPVYQLNDRITIPGSSLRGVLRSAYETLTNSCMVTMNPDEHITKRSDLGTFSPGVLKREGDEWKLYPAERIALVGNAESGYRKIQERDDKKYKKYSVGIEKKEKYLIGDDKEKLYFGDEVRIQANGPGHAKGSREVWNYRSVSDIRKGSQTDCYLYIGEIINNKHAESVFRITKNSNSLSWPKKMLDQAIMVLEETLAMYRSASINRNYHASSNTHYGYPGYERAKRNGILPIWYREEHGKLYLSLAAIGRIAYQNTMDTITNSHKPCMDRKQLCPACAIFGMIGKNDKNNKDNKGMGSRVRITDACIQENGSVISDITLKELGSPRTSYLPFYSKDGKSYDAPAASIKGRKYYWHNPKAAEDSGVYSTSEKTNRNGTYDLIQAGSKFQFRVYYDQLTEEQVQMLIWTLTLGGNDTNHMHKIGHGKPLGLGSVKITITEQQERAYSEASGYAMTMTEYTEDMTMAENTVEKLLDHNSWEQMSVITEYVEGSKANIQYPYVIVTDDVKRTIEQKKAEGFVLKENIMASHQWFSKYRKDQEPGLPDILHAKDQELPICELIEVDDSNSRYSSFQRLSGNSGQRREEKKRGKVKRYFPDRGYGFITSGDGKDVYFKISQVRDGADKLKEGVEVEYVEKNNTQGITATNCRIL